MSTLNAAQRRRWHEMVDRRAASLSPQEWVFHGTTLSSACRIAVEGFKPRGFPLRDRSDQTGVFWGVAGLAKTFSLHNRYDFPAIIAARLDDVRAAGDLYPDLWMWETETGSRDWNHPDCPQTAERSYEICRTFVSSASPPVAKLRVLTLSKGVFVRLACLAPNLDARFGLAMG